MGLLSGLFGGGEDEGAKESAKLQKQMAQEWQKLVVPTAESLQLDLPDYNLTADTMTPEQTQLYLQQQSDLANYQGDPGLRMTQENSLSNLNDIVNDPSLSDIDKAQLYQILRTQETNARGARDAVTQGAAERGISGSGLELVNQMLANQGAANQSAAGGYELAGQAEQRRRDAIVQSGNMAGDIRGQDLTEAEKVASAKDMINKFNTQQKSAQDQWNADQRAKVNAMEQARRDAEYDSRWKAQAEEAKRSADTSTAVFGMERDKLAGQTGQLGGVTDALSAQDAAKNNKSAQMMSTVGTLAGAAALAFSDRNMKTDIEPIGDDEARKMLGELTGYKYEYKPEYQDMAGYGEHTGVMAQDLEKSELGRGMVEEAPEGKMVDYDPATITALLASLNSRLERVENK